MTIQQMFDDFRRDCEKAVRQNLLDTAIYVSGTKQKETKFNALIEKYESDSKLDLDLGINDTMREFEQKAYVIMKKSMKFYKRY